MGGAIFLFTFDYCVTTNSLIFPNILPLRIKVET